MTIDSYANRFVCDLVAYEPGKPIDETARELGLDPAQIVKVASNENPLGPSPRAKSAMRAALDEAHIYPDGGGYRLRTALAESLGLERANVVLGNGSNEIIELLCHTFLNPRTELIAAQHALVLVNHGHASGQELLQVARQVVASVKDRFGITLEPEPRILGADF